MSLRPWSLKLATDIHDNLLIADTDTNTVTLVSREGQLIHKMLRFTPESGLKEILQIVVNSESSFSLICKHEVDGSQEVRLHRYLYTTTEEDPTCASQILYFTVRPNMCKLVPVLYCKTHHVQVPPTCTSSVLKLPHTESYQ